MSGLAPVAVLLAMAAAALAWRAPRRPVTPGSAQLSGRSRTRWRARIGSGRAGLLLLAGLAAVLVVETTGRRLLLALIVLAAVAGAVVLAGRARASRAAERRRERVVETCEALVGELRSGQPVARCLEHVAGLWPDLAPVAAAARVGADVPASLRRLGALSGAEGLTDVAAAWQVSDRSGAGLAFALGQVAESARERQATRHIVVGELASAQATARLVALLPIASLAMSAGIGGDPWHFLLATTPGLACLGAGLALAFAGLLWIDRIAVAVLAR